MSAVHIPGDAPAPDAPAASVAPLCTGLSAALAVLYVATAAAPALLPLTALVPAYTFLAKHRVWNVATHALVETQLPLLLLNLAVLNTFGRRLELAAGAPAMAALLAVTAVATAAVLILGGAFFDGVTHRNAMSAAFSGFLPCSMAILVALWQRAPNAPVSGATGDVRFTFVPFAAVALCVAADLVFDSPLPTDEEVTAEVVMVGSPSVAAVVGWYTAWFYLRFLRAGAAAAPAAASGAKKAAAGAVSNAGDPSASFALHMMFPGPLRVAMLLVGAALFPVARLLGVGAAVAQAAGQAEGAVAGVTPAPSRAAQGAGGVKPQPGATVTEADRRRQAALAALSQRLERAKELEAAAKASAPADDSPA
jgi:hypothetical protein